MSVDIPNYRLVEKLGEGANSAIYRARNMRNGQDYAVKVVKIVKPEDASFVELLKAEHAIANAIDHEVVRKVFELRLLRQRLRVRGAILFMEYVNGISMAAREFRRPLDKILSLFIRSAEGLHAMHKSGYVHADLKPNNIMVRPDEEVKLIDLGQSAKMNEAKPRIQGTLNYIAPEQVNREKLDARTDVFGLGATLQMVLTGKAVKTELNSTASIHSQSLVGRRLSTHVDQNAAEELPACVVRLIEDACRPLPDDRIHDMPALVQRFELARTIVEKHRRARTEEAPAAARAKSGDEEDRIDKSFEEIAEEMGFDSDTDVDPAAEESQ